MEIITILSLASSALATQVVDYTIWKQAKPQLNTPFSRRDAIDTSDFTNGGVAYLLNISVGSPGQLQTVQIDTGSSDLFVTDSNAPYCRNNTCAGGTFNASKSSTFQVVAPETFNITYADGSTDAGDLVSDVVQIRDRVITNVTMGLAYNVNPNGGDQYGILGLTYSLRESTVDTNGFSYSNFVETLVNAGAIASRLFSLYLSDLGQYGSIIFGGVDTQKFEGTLVTLNCFPARSTTSNFRFTMSGLTLVGENGTATQLISRNNTQNGFFDSGTTTWDVPEDLYNKIVELTGFVLSPEAGLPIRLCVDVSRNTAFNFQSRGFAGINSTTAPLRVLLSQMILPLVSSTGVPYTDPSGKQYCGLPIAPSKRSSYYLWGDAIMRAGYFVYDLDNNQVSIGQAKYSEESNIVAVQAGPHGLANAINQPQYAQAVQTYPPVPFATDFSRKASVYTTNNTIGVASILTAIGSSSPEFSSPAYTNSTSKTTYTSVSSVGPSNLEHSGTSTTPSSTSFRASLTSETSSTTGSWYSGATPSVDEVAFLRAQVAKLQEKLESCGCQY